MCRSINVVIMLSLSVAMATNLFTPPVRMAILLDDHLLDDAAHEYIQQQEQRLHEIKGLLSQLPPNTSAENPIDAYHFLRHTTKVHSLMANNKPLERYHSKMKNAVVPSLNDVTDAAAYLDTIKSVYRANLTELIRGHVMNQVDMGMSQKDVLRVATILFQKGLMDKAIPWFRHLFKHPTPDVNHVDVAIKLTICNAEIFKLPELYRMLKTVNKLIQNGTAVENYIRKLDSNMAKAHKSIFTSKTSDAEITPSLCRGRAIKVADPRVSVCSYKRLGVPYFRVKQEVLSARPYVVFYHDVISQRQNRALTKVSKQALTSQSDAELSSNKLGNYHPSTHSHWVAERNNGLLSWLGRRMSMITGLRLSEHVSMHQIENYGVGAFATLKMDIMVNSTKSPNTDDYMRMRAVSTGMASYVLFLRTAVAGGSWAFPRGRVAHQGAKNGALVWYSREASGDPDFTSMYSVCPMIHGEMLVLRKWFHTSDQTFHRPCNLRRFSPHVPRRRPRTSRVSRTMTC